MSEELPPLPDDVLALLAVEKPLIVVDVADRARAFARVEASLASLGATAGGAAATSALVSIAKGKLALLIGAAFVGGALAGGVAVTAMRSEAKRENAAPPLATALHSEPDRAAAVSPPSAPATAPAIPIEDLLPASSSKAARPSASTSAAADDVRAQGLAAERAVLDVARGALARGTPDAALDATRRHAKEYPNGVLAEEREALAIRALIALGQRSEASARAERFRARHPRSLMLPAIEGALEGAGP